MSKNWNNWNSVDRDGVAESLAIKCYDDQINIDGNFKQKEEFLYENIKKINPNDIQVLCIKHDQDDYIDKDGNISRLKTHFHVILRMNEPGATKPVEEIMNALGIYFKSPENDNLWNHRGVETVKNFANYALYLTHESEKARKYKKRIYDLDAIVSNLSIEEIKEIRSENIFYTNQNVKTA